VFFIPKYILILFFLIIVDYSAGILIENARGRKRKFFLILSIIANCLILFAFKYFNFFADSVGNLAKLIHWNYSLETLSLILPIGLSFHTFQSMAYTIEVYRGKQKSERNIGIYSLYVMFYPQLVAGPIERPQNLIHQFYEKHYFEYKRITEGLKLMLWGLFKKIVIADRAALIVDQVYNNVYDYQGLSLIIATVLFAFQIYCDFSGYSDIAIGSAQVMGFKLMKNFNQPYLSKSISEFWHRWHISLSTWFRDYLYIALGGSRVSRPHWYFNLFITFLVSGLWHGANWTFVIWGALNGFYIVFSVWTKKLREKILNLFRIAQIPVALNSLRIIVTFSLTCIAWVFFRANSVKDAFYILVNIFGGFSYAIFTNFKFDILVVFFAVFFIEVTDYLRRNKKLEFSYLNKYPGLRWIFYYILIFGILLFGEISRKPFIYFQF
jgi:D-alanyl-lipoteichoic acid acyltransferase DltB (MBOAT superfamily)